jgi:protocatechuate 3,4-dioxygenase beta subunit
MLILFVALAACFAWLMLDSGQTPIPVKIGPKEVTPKMVKPAPAVTAPAEMDEVTTPGVAPPAPAMAAEAPIPEERTAKPPKRGSGSIKGKVLDPEENPAEGATVALERQVKNPHITLKKDAPLSTVIADEEGSFLFESLPMGGYIVAAETAEAEYRNSVSLSAQRKDAEMTLRLIYSGSIGGLVVDRGGEAVSGATVYPCAWQNEGGDGPLGGETGISMGVLSDEDGRFLIPKIGRNSRYKVCVKAEGFAPLLSEFLATGVEDVRLVLESGGSAMGVVVEAESGDAVPKLKIRIGGDYGIVMHETLSDKEGVFRFDNMAAGAHRMNINDQKFVLAENTASFSLSQGQERSGIRLEVHEGGVIAGRIYEQESDAGLGGVRIRAFSEGLEPGISRETTTDRDGTYRIEGLASAAYAVQHDEVKGYGHDYQKSRKSVTAKTGDLLSGVDFALSRGLRVSGIVVDEEGQPVEGASINGYNQRTGANQRNTRTDDDGTFILAGLTPSSNYHLSIRKDGMAAPQIDPMDIGMEDVAGLRFEMQVASSIEGIVVDRYGNPQEGFQMQARDLDSNQWVNGSQTATGGVFKIDSLAEGRYGILVNNSNSWRNDMPVSAEVNLVRGEPVKGLRIVYEGPEGLTISGRVTNRDGDPVESAYLNANGRSSFGSARTDNEGRYEIAGLEEGLFNIQVQHGGHSGTNEREIPAGSTDIDFVLAGRGTITGTIIAQQSGDPVTNFEMLQRKGNVGKLEPWMESNFRAFHDSEGRFSLPNIEEGDATLIVRANGYAPAFMPVSGVKENEVVDGIVIPMEGGVSLDGAVADAAGNPVANAQVFSGAVPDEWQREQGEAARTGSDGTFRLDSLPAGSHTLGVYHPDFAPTDISVDLSPNYDNTVQITLTMGGMVEGRVTQGGVGVADQHVSVNYMNGRGQNNSARTDANGYYSIAGLPDGEAMVYCSVSSPGGSNRNRQITATILAEQVTQVDFDFSLASASVEGVVYGEEDTPLAQVHVNGTVNDGGAIESVGTQTDANGYFLLENLPAGSVSLMVYAQGYSQKSVQVELINGQRAYKDISLYGGATITVTVSNAPEVAREVAVAALRGEIEIPEGRSMETLMLLQKDLAAAAEAGENGVGHLTGLEPGVYTIVAVAIPGADGNVQQEDLFADLQVIAEVVTVEKVGDKLEVNLRF